MKFVEISIYLRISDSRSLAACLRSSQFKQQRRCLLLPNPQKDLCQRVPLKWSSYNLKHHKTQNMVFWVHPASFFLRTHTFLYIHTYYHSISFSIGHQFTFQSINQKQKTWAPVVLLLHKCHQLLTLQDCKMKHIQILVLLFWGIQGIPQSVNLHFVFRLARTLLEHLCRKRHHKKHHHQTSMISQSLEEESWRKKDLKRASFNRFVASTSCCLSIFLVTSSFGGRGTWKITVNRKAVYNILTFSILNFQAASLSL